MPGFSLGLFSTRLHEKTWTHSLLPSFRASRRKRTPAKEPHITAIAPRRKICFRSLERERWLVSRSPAGTRVSATGRREALHLGQLTRVPVRFDPAGARSDTQESEPAPRNFPEVRGASWMWAAGG